MEPNSYYDQQTGLTLKWWPVGGSGTSFFFIGDITGEVMRVTGSHVYLFGVELSALKKFMERTNIELTKDFSLSSSVATKIRKHTGSGLEQATYGGSRPGSGRQSVG